MALSRGPGMGGALTGRLPRLASAHIGGALSEGFLSTV